jgi:periplasmic copper chaperone A
MLKRLVVSTVVLLSGGVLLATAVEAHIEPNPKAVKAGSKVTVNFNVAHGCGSSPTTKLQIKIPSGVAVSNPAGPASMVSKVAGDVVTFDGLVTGKNRKVFLTLQFPKTPGLLSFPIVQTCKSGKESWIELPNDANPNPKLPAPQILVK